MTATEQAACALDNLLTFVVKTDVSADLDRLMDLVMECWSQACEDGKEEEARLYDAARELIHVTAGRRKAGCYGYRPPDPIQEA